jgi:alkanesulfonate monooxygenase SsuD/methylene tetrahydromethanopterin reductase-like flavin-dependent oxidoreductase (luciferase family)
MKVGMFEMSAHPPERGFYEGAQWDLQMVRWADEYDIDEVWIGEHYFEPWEPCPAPDLLIAQALRETKRVRLGAGCHLLPCHHPLSLAYRVAFLDHLSQGRLNVGVGAAAGKNDMQAFGMTKYQGQNREMMEEALDIMMSVWDPTKPVDIKGKFWEVTRVDKPGTLHTSHIYPFQKPHPPMAVAGFSPKSPSLTTAGKYGFWPLSFDMNKDSLRMNWQSVEEGAAMTGRTPDRNDWRIVRVIVVADTDEEARKVALNGFLGRYYHEFFIPTLTELGALDLFKTKPDMPNSAVTPEFMCDNHWMCGSPETVAREIEKIHKLTGGFGVIVMLAMDYSEQPEAWRKSMELFGREVKPRIARLVN